MISAKKDLHSLESESPIGTGDIGDECGDEIGEIEDRDVNEYQSNSELGTDRVENGEENHVINVIEINNRLKAAIQYSRKVNAMGKGPEETNKKMQEYSRRMNGTGKRKVNAMGKGPKETINKMQEYSRRMNGTGNGTSGDEIGEIEDKEVTEYQSKSEKDTDGVENGEENHIIDVVEINNRLKTAIQCSRKVNAMGKGPKETINKMQEYSRRMDGAENGTGCNLM
eukprot:CAMPEP_0198275886 /NCGR_PEP_ID=MMETSP1447-20131203/65018_1 /TAXON_ID=420782 /ORGANISM="Chaetoceros dichaeta, Strain CCMP1751" /LENGTH=225 /DNA_ID=CAMNT_0043970793 /DNA_START=216 /DNA_END=894 /DNA_ORIENTATION=-